MPELKNASRQGLLDQQFIERLMLAVTQRERLPLLYVWAYQSRFFRLGCRRRILKIWQPGSWTTARKMRYPALLYAQHFAETKSKPDSEMNEHIIRIYGTEIHMAILAYLRMITMGNLLGNTFDAILSRFKGKPAPESSFINEIGVFLSMPFLFAAAFIHSAKKPKTKESRA